MANNSFNRGEYCQQITAYEQPLPAECITQTTTATPHTPPIVTIRSGGETSGSAIVLAFLVLGFIISIRNLIVT